MKNLKRILHYLRPHVWLCVLAAFAGLLSVAATLLMPYLIGAAITVIDETLPALDWTKLGNYSIALVIALSVATLSGYGLQILSGTMGYKIAAAIRRDCLTRIGTAKLEELDNIPYGDIIARIGVDSDVVSDGLLQGFAQLYSGVFSVIGTIGFMLWIDVSTALVVICITPLSLVVSVLIARSSHKVFSSQAVLRGEMGGIVNESFTNQKLIKAYGYEEETETRFDGVNQKLDKVGTRAQFISAVINPATRFVNSIVYAAVAVYGAINIIRGNTDMTVGGLSSFLLYANQYTRPFNDISAVAAELQSASASAARVFALIDLPSESDVADAVLPPVSGDVELQNVAFSYSADKPFIEGFSLSVKKGQRIAIVGPTGCGKSTLINLLMRFYDLDGGEIRIDNTPVKNVTRASVRTSFGMVLQETWLANASVADNIAYGRPNATRQEIIAAAAAARCHRFIMQLPQGYDTQVTDDGAFSSGQKQLLCIARVMLMSPPMLILDEATSNIDTRTERRIQRALSELSAGKTSFIVAHRFSTIIDADMILVMKDGKIIEEGTHTKLMAQKGFYAQLFNAQFN